MLKTLLLSLPLIISPVASQDQDMGPKSGAALPGYMASAGFSSQKASAPVKIPVLMYHHFSTDRQKALANPMIIWTDDFEEQIKYLSENQFSFLTYNDMLQIIREKKEIPPKPVLITIDDGYESNYTLAFPILKKYNAKASISVITGLVRDIGYNPNAIPHMSWSQMKEMEDSGLVEFHNHTFNLHRSNGPGAALVTPNANESQEQFRQRIAADLKHSKAVLESNLQGKVTNLTFPYGVYNQQSIQIADSLGHSTYSLYDWGYADGKSRLLPRILIDEFPLEYFKDLAHGRVASGKNP